MEEIFGRPSGPLQVRRTGQTLYNVIFCKGLREIEALGSPKVTLGNPSIFAFCINLGKRDKERDFFLGHTGGPIVKKNYFLFAIKNCSFPVEESAVGFSKWCAMDGRKMNYFVFQHMSMNCEIVLTL